MGLAGLHSEAGRSKIILERLLSPASTNTEHREKTEHMLKMSQPPAHRGCNFLLCNVSVCTDVIAETWGKYRRWIPAPKKSFSAIFSSLHPSLLSVRIFSPSAFPAPFSLKHFIVLKQHHLVAYSSPLYGYCSATYQSMENVTLQQFLCFLHYLIVLFLLCVYLLPNLILALVFNHTVHCYILSLSGKCRKCCWKGLNLSLSFSSTNIN